MAARKKPTKTKRKKPAKQATKPRILKPGASPISGVVPPPDKRFKPGESGNISGRAKNAGATISEQLNILTHDEEMDEEGLRNMARGARVPIAKRIAARQLLRTIEAGDIADYAKLLEGQETLEQARERGVNTSLIKKIKRKSHYEKDEDDEPLLHTEAELELHDRVGDSFDRVCDRTDGRPRQAVDVTGNDNTLKTLADGEIAADQALARVAARLGIKRDGAG